MGQKVPKMVPYCSPQNSYSFRRFSTKSPSLTPIFSASARKRKAVTPNGLVSYGISFPLIGRVFILLGEVRETGVECSPHCTNFLLLRLKQSAAAQESVNPRPTPTPSFGRHRKFFCFFYTIFGFSGYLLLGLPFFGVCLKRMANLLAMWRYRIIAY